MHTQRWKDGMWSSFASRWHSIDNSSPISINKTCSSSSYPQIHRTFWTKGKAGIKLRTCVAEIRGVQLRTSRSWPAHLTGITSFQTKHSYTAHSFIKRKKSFQAMCVFFSNFPLTNEHANTYTWEVFRCVYRKHSKKSVCGTEWRYILWHSLV